MVSRGGDALEPLLTCSVCRLVRESIPDAALGLFVHTPFPSSEVFRCLPREYPIVSTCDTEYS